MNFHVPFSIGLSCDVRFYQRSTDQYISLEVQFCSFLTCLYFGHFIQQLFMSLFWAAMYINSGIPATCMFTPFLNWMHFESNCPLARVACDGICSISCSSAAIDQVVICLCRRTTANAVIEGKEGKLPAPSFVPMLLLPHSSAVTGEPHEWIPHPWIAAYKNVFTENFFNIWVLTS